MSIPIISKLIMAYRTAKTIRRFVKMIVAEAKQIDTTVTGYLTDEWGCEFRWRIETIILRAYRYADTGLLAFFESDNHLLRLALIVIKSDALYAISQARNDKERQRAIDDLLSKDRKRTLTKLSLWDGRSSGNSQQYPVH